MLKFVAGQSMYPRAGEIGVKFNEAFEEVSRDRINHTVGCIPCRRLWSTLQFQLCLAEDQVWAALVAEFLKLLSSSGVHSKFRGFNLIPVHTIIVISS